MSQIIRAASTVLEEFRDTGHISPRSRAAARLDRSERVSPGWVLVTAVELVVNLRREVDDVAVEDIVSELRSPGSHALVVDLIVRSSLGDIDAQRELHSRELLDVSDLTAILATAVERNGISGGELNKLLEMSEKACHELYSAGDAPALHPAKRGVLTGPWDAGEREARDGEIDFGGLRIPVSSGYELAPGWAGDGLEAVTVAWQETSLQLQAFHDTTWEANRVEWQADIRTRSGRVSEFMGPAGVELRGWTVRARPDGEKVKKDVRLLGCDGPGWMLYGVIRGRGAHPDSTDLWAYKVFEHTVVDASYSPAFPGRLVALNWPE